MVSENKREQIEMLIERGYEFNISEYLSEAWNIFRQNIWGFVGFYLVAIVIGLSTNIVPFIGPIASAVVLTPTLYVGFSIVSNLIQRNEEYPFEKFFRGFDFIGTLSIQQLLLFLVFIALFIPVVIMLLVNGSIIEWIQGIQIDPTAAAENIPEIGLAIGLALSVALIPMVHLSVAYSGAWNFVVFYKTDAWAGLEYSRRLITKQWFSVFLLYVVLGLIGIVPVGFVILLGVMAGLTIGYLFWVLIVLLLLMFFCVYYPFLYCVVYAAFADVTKLNETIVEDNILQHLVE